MAKAKSSEVKDYAKTIILDHEQTKEMTQKISEQNKVKPKYNVRTESRSISTEKDIALLSLKKGDEFDRAYLKTEIQNHEKWIDDLKGNLIPNAKNPVLKKELMGMEQVMKKHLENAQRIERNLL